MISTPRTVHAWTFLSICTVVLTIAARSEGQIVDNFNYVNNAALEAVWGAPMLGGDNAASFTYSTGAGELNATSLIDNTANVGFGTTIFSRPVSHSGDLRATMEFNWDQTTNALGAMFLELRGPSGVIASGGLGDDTMNAAYAYMQVGGNTTFLGPDGSYVGGTNTFENQTGAIATSFQGGAINTLAAQRAAKILGVSGSARLDIVRLGDQIELAIDNGIDVFSLGPITGSTDDVTSINLIFAAFTFPGGPSNALVGDSGGHIAISSVSLVPEPHSLIGLVLGSMLLLPALRQHGRARR